MDYHLQDWSTEARQKRADYMARQHPRAPRDMDYRLHFAERFAYLPEYRKLQRKARRIVAAARLEMEKLDARRQAVSRNPGESARQKQSVFEHLTKQQKRVAIEACEQAEAAHERRPPNPNPGIRNGSKQRWGAPVD